MTTKPQCYQCYQCYRDRLREAAFLMGEAREVFIARCTRLLHSPPASFGGEIASKTDQAITDRRNPFAKTVQKQHIGCVMENIFVCSGNAWATFSDAF